MPELEKSVVDDIVNRLQKYLQKLDGYGDPEHLGSGGSAAVYRVNFKDGVRVFKGFNPEFFNGNSGAAERRRLEVQRRLIGHKCPSIVQTYRVEEAEGTAFIEMEFLSWPSLKSELANIPDETVAPLIMQLVEAIHFLETQGIVHRDVKPENIHISPNYKHLKLLDLGVAREFEAEDTEDAAITDHGNLRPFLATAQYSSPEYLFRLDAPSPRLWKGLNFYQIGAVLHDLIMKKPLFQHEVEIGNRWLVARAVLTKTPSFACTNPTRLASLKALAARCLVKDIETRLQLIGWEDFILEGSQDPIVALKGRLAKGGANAGIQAKVSTESRLEFDRTEFMNRITNCVRTEINNACGTQLPSSLISPIPGESPTFKFKFSTPHAITIDCDISFLWSDELYSRTATIMIKAKLATEDKKNEMLPTSSQAICATVISEAEEEAIHSTANELARVVGRGLDLIDGAIDIHELVGTDLLLS
jgi:serine/threonine-protein kinase